MSVDFGKIVEAVEKLAAVVGWLNAFIAITFMLLVAVIYKLVSYLLAEKQRQIDGLATENREYRDRFTQIMDNHHALKTKGEDA